jgi:hypothetical protein
MCEANPGNGEGGIRTPVELPQNRFRVCRIQPLCHLSWRDFEKSQPHCTGESLLVHHFEQCFGIAMG